MKKVFIILSVFSISQGCVKNSQGVAVEIQVVTDDFAIEDNLANSPVSNFITPKLIECSEPLKLQPQASLIRFNGAETEELKVEFHKNFFQNLFEAKIDEEKGKKLLESYEIPKEWKTNKFQNAKSSILKYLKDLHENVIILADKKYDSLQTKSNLLTFKNDEEFKSLLTQIYCENKTQPNKIVILHNLKSFGNNGIETGPDEGEGDPCTQTTVADGLNLKEDLVKIIDTRRTYKERDKLARETWEKYFDPMAAVKMYLKPDQKYPEGMWESGDGANYFIDRLAYLNSITDVNIIRIEYHRDTKKISGIVVVECHNASEVQ